MRNDGDYFYKRTIQYVDPIFKFLTYFEAVFAFCLWTHSKKIFVKKGLLLQTISTKELIQTLKKFLLKF